MGGTPSPGGPPPVPGPGNPGPRRQNTAPSRPHRPAPLVSLVQFGKCAKFVRFAPQIVNVLNLQNFQKHFRLQNFLNLWIVINLLNLVNNSVLKPFLLWVGSLHIDLIGLLNLCHLLLVYLTLLPELEVLPFTILHLALECLIVHGQVINHVLIFSQLIVLFNTPAWHFLKFLLKGVILPSQVVELFDDFVTFHSDFLEFELLHLKLVLQLGYVC